MLNCGFQVDTNIVMDMQFFGNGPAQDLQTAIDKGQIQRFTATEYLAELERVSAYPEFGLNLAARDVRLSGWQ